MRSTHENTRVEILAANGTPIRRGTVSGITDDGSVLVSPADSEADPIPCEVLITGDRAPEFALGDRVMYIAGSDADTLGCVLGRIGRAAETGLRDFVPDPDKPAQLKAKKIEIIADEGIVIKCGDGSITVGADGSVAVRGTRVLSRSKSVNKIKGGSVQIN